MFLELIETSEEAKMRRFERRFLDFVRAFDICERESVAFFGELGVDKESALHCFDSLERFGEADRVFFASELDKLDQRGHR